MDWLFGGSRPSSAKAAPTAQSFIVHWTQRKQPIQVSFPVTTTTVRRLKEHLTAITNVPCAVMKLMHGGKLLRDDGAMLSLYGVKEGSRVMLLGSPEAFVSRAAAAPATTASAAGKPTTRPTSASSASPPPSKSASASAVLPVPHPVDHCARIAAIIISLPEIALEVRNFEWLIRRLRPGMKKDLDDNVLVELLSVAVAATATETTSEAKDGDEAAPVSSSAIVVPKASLSDPADATEKRLDYSYRYLSEHLTRVLLKLDGVTLPPEETKDVMEARQRRRQAVRHVQRLIDYVDDLQQRVVAEAKQQRK